MKKSISATNDFCPQTMFLYGTYKDDGTPNFGLFCWFSYCWDSELGVMACIGGEKPTKDKIRATRVFSANLVTEELLPFADYCGNKGGKNIPAEVEKGRVLDVPILTKSPWVYELEVVQTIALDGSDVFLCKIKNVLVDQNLWDADASHEEKIKTIKPAQTVGGTYFGWNGSSLGEWGVPMKSL